MSEEDMFDDNNTYIGEEEEEEVSDSISSIIFEEEEDDVKIDPKKNQFNSCISKFRIFVPDISLPEYVNDSLSFSIPSSFLPVTLRVAYGFIYSEILLDFFLLLDDYNWRKSPVKADISNPVNRNYSGKALVEKAKDHFFALEYKPKTNYRSAPLFLRLPKDADHQLVKRIEEAGYSHMQAVRAASLCDNDFDRCITFLQTGHYRNDISFPLPLTYADCPLLYFILEVFDAILDLQDHCAMCGEPITPGLKPVVCNRDICNHRFVKLGVGNSLCKEIRRDPFVADLLFSVFACTYKTMYFDPKPEIPQKKSLDEIIEKMPSMKKLADCHDDAALLQKIGRESLDILRWVVLTCRSNFLCLPNSLEFPQFRSSKSDSRCFQFMAITASPEQENIFQQMKKKYGSRFLWHGSPTDRWHSIIRNGLKNMSGTRFMGVGAAHGPGIYFAPDSNTSLGYSRFFKNAYPNSKLAEDLQIIALCEVINLPLEKTVKFDAVVDGCVKHLEGFLKDHGWCLTLTLNEACIVRFLFVGLDKSVNVSNNPPKNIPNINQVLRMRANI